MDVKPVVFALILGWVTGSSELPPTFISWLETRETLGQRATVASCTADGVDFDLKQVYLDISQRTSPAP